jgi:sugar phosphate permease
MTSSIGLKWEMTYMYMGQLCFAMAIINSFFLIVHPEEKGLVVEEIDETMQKHEEMLRKSSINAEPT